MHAAALSRSERLQSDRYDIDKRGRLVDRRRIRSISLIEKFHIRMRPIENVSGCWNWDSVNKSTGYGELKHFGRRWLAHRLSYELHVGPIPEELQIDHICRNRACVNPSHLRTVTISENVLAGIGVTAENKRKTHCINGHEFDAENTKTYKKKSGRLTRVCIACKKVNSKAYVRAVKSSDLPCVICGGGIAYAGSRVPATCSQSCAVKLSHRTCPRRPPRAVSEIIIDGGCTV